MNNKIGLSIITHRRFDYIKQCLTSLKNNNYGGADFVTVIQDGFDYTTEQLDELIKLLPEGGKIHSQANKGVANAKNNALKLMLQEGCEHLFLMEDDILMKHPETCNHYINYAQKHNIKHLNFAHHGPANVNNPAIWKGVCCWRNCVGAFSYYTKDLIEEVGFMDEGLVNIWEHCLGPETEILTSDGWKEIKSLENTEQTLLTEGGKWVKAPITSFGKQELQEITLNKKTKSITIRATPNHEWILSNGTRTRELKEGDKLKEVNTKTIENNLWTVKSIKPSTTEEVYCATVEGTHSFVIKGNILTGNCEHTYRVIKAGHHPPFWHFADHPQSKKMLEEIPGSIEYSSIRIKDEWASSLQEGTERLKKRYGEWPPGR